jgi:hypothetical protein
MQADMMITLSLFNMTSADPCCSPKAIAHFTMPTAMPEVEFSKLETTLITEDIRVRPISKDGRHMQRHAEGNEHEVNELDLDFDVDLRNYPFSAINSFQDMFSGIMYQKHVGQLAHFSTETSS